MFFFVHDLTNRIKTPIKPATSFNPVDQVSETNATKAIHTPPEPNKDTINSQPKAAREYLPEKKSDQYAKGLTAIDVMSSPIATQPANSDINAILAKISQHQTHHVVLVNNQEIITGIASIETLLRQKSEKPMEKYLAEDYLLPVVSTNSNTPVEKIASIMLENSIEAILVMDGDFAVGIITPTNFIKLIAKQGISIDFHE